MIKARARVERAATRQAAAAVLNSTVPRSTHPASTSTPPVPQEQTFMDAPDPQAQDGEEHPPPSSAKDPTSDRVDLLRSKPAVVGRFMQLIVPILIDVYAASVITPVRVKTLTGLLKAVSFLDEEGLRDVLKV
jgi:E3 ubiquitin-protein ligase TRIP12